MKDEYGDEDDDNIEKCFLRINGKSVNFVENRLKKRKCIFAHWPRADVANLIITNLLVTDCSF